VSSTRSAKLAPELGVLGAVVPDRNVAVYVLGPVADDRGDRRRRLAIFNTL
jgi:hypothetical protein